MIGFMHICQWIRPASFPLYEDHHGRVMVAGVRTLVAGQSGLAGPLLAGQSDLAGPLLARQSDLAFGFQFEEFNVISKFQYHDHTEVKR